MTDSFPKLSLTFSEAGYKDGLDLHQPPDTALGPERPEVYTASRGWLERGRIQPTAGWAGPLQGQRPAQERLLLAPRSPPPAQEPSCQLRREHPIKCVLVSEKHGFCKDTDSNRRWNVWHGFGEPRPVQLIQKRGVDRAGATTGRFLPRQRGPQGVGGSQLGTEMSRGNENQKSKKSFR